jgi:hypothetical protein
LLHFLLHIPLHTTDTKNNEGPEMAREFPLAARGIEDFLSAITL